MNSYQVRSVFKKFTVSFSVILVIGSHQLIYPAFKSLFHYKKLLFNQTLQYGVNGTVHKPYTVLQQKTKFLSGMTKLWKFFWGLIFRDNILPTSRKPGHQTTAMAIKKTADGQGVDLLVLHRQPHCIPGEEDVANRKSLSVGSLFNGSEFLRSYYLVAKLFHSLKVWVYISYGFSILCCSVNLWTGSSVEALLAHTNPAHNHSVLLSPQVIFMDLHSVMGVLNSASRARKYEPYPLPTETWQISFQKLRNCRCLG